MSIAPLAGGSNSTLNGAIDTYLIIGADSTNSPLNIIEDAPSDLSDTDNGADYILITHKDIGWQAGGAPYQWLTDLVALATI